MKEVMRKERKSNFELLRILAMLGIVLSHFNTHSGFTAENPLAFNFNFFLTIIGQVGIISNIIFILISGYFLVKSDPKPKKIFKLIAEMYFYSILIFLGVKLFTNQEISAHALKETFLPFPYGNWYCVMYIILYLFSPYLNRLIKNLDKKEFKKLIIISFILFSLVPFCTSWGVLSRLSIFVLGYFIGAYIRLYVSENIERKTLIKWVVISLIALFGVATTAYLAAIILNKPFFLTIANGIFVANSSPFVIAAAISIFLLFRSLDIKQNKVINLIAASTLGIYLIHENIFLRTIIWRETVSVDINSISTLQFIVFAILKVLIVFGICLTIDLIRASIFKLFERGKK